MIDADALLDAFEARATAFQNDVVIPHCSVCSRPCCALTDVVLDLSFTEVHTLYRIGGRTTAKNKREFDQRLPPTVRRQDGRYYAHGEPCPAYDVTGHACTVYGTPKKPQGCSDFPLYADGDGLTADLRCEAIAAARTQLQPLLQQAVDDVAAGAVVVVEEADDAFPDFFVRFVLEPRG